MNHLLNVVEIALKKCKENNLTISENVISAMKAISRKNFIPENEQKSAQFDRPIPIFKRQTISAPHIVMMMLAEEAADINSEDSILELGSGSGYNTALLSSLASKGKVLSIERHKSLVDFATANLRKISLPNNYEIREGDGTLESYSEKFDKIVVTATGPYIPDSLLNQLKPTGRIVMPVAVHSEQELVVCFFNALELSDGLTSATVSHSHISDYLQANSDFSDKVQVKKLVAVRFVPLIGKFGYKD